MRTWLLILLLLPCVFPLAQTGVQKDTAAIQVRPFNASSIQDYKADDAYAYDKLREPALSWWDKFWIWFWWKVNQLMSTPGGKTTIWTILLVFGLSIIAFFVLKVTGMNKDGLFGRSSNGLAYSTSSEDIHQINFDQEITEAIATGNYRLAIRLLYLQALKKLSDRRYIEWQVNKTNTDYLNEVKERPFHPVFQLLTSNFEYTWYGETQLEKERFTILQQQFTQFNSQVQ